MRINKADLEALGWAVKEVHIKVIRTGDTVEHCGKVMTVCSSDIKRGFMGKTIFGDSYRLGTLPVIKLTPKLGVIQHEDKQS